MRGSEAWRSARVEGRSRTCALHGLAAPHPVPRPSSAVWPPRRVPRLLSLTGGWKETSPCVFSKRASVLLPPLAIQLPLGPKSISRKHLPPTRAEVALADRSTPGIPEGLELFWRLLLQTLDSISCNSNLLPSVHLLKLRDFRAEDRLMMSVVAACRNCLWIHSGQRQGQGAGCSPMSLPNTAQPRCVGGPECLCHLACCVQCKSGVGLVPIRPTASTAANFFQNWEVYSSLYWEESKLPKFAWRSTVWWGCPCTGEIQSGASRGFARDSGRLRL